jgi:alkylation response protein AidB-like acyl-CoA dehydrogenase
VKGKGRKGGSFLLEEASPDEIFVPEEFTREHKDIAKAIEDFIKGEITSREKEIENLDFALSRELMEKAGELGFLGIDIPEKYGGMELDKISSALVSERLGFGAGSFTITELNHTGIGTLPVAFFGTEDQKKKYLPGLCSGKRIGAFGLTEPEAGSDALNPRTTATLSADGKHYILNGAKQFITNAGFADVIFTYAKVDDRHFTAFIVEQGWEGVSTDEEEKKMGMHGTSTRAYHFDNVRVPVENVLGEVGKGHVVALNALNMGRYKVGAVCIGSAKRAFFEAVKYAKQRTQFGKAICEFGLIKKKLSEMAIRIYAAESMMYRTAGLIDAALMDLDKGPEQAGVKTARALEEYLIECSINKVYGSETEDYVVDEEVQIFGGYGFIQGNHPELAYRNARINRIWEGTNEINRVVIANTLIRKAQKGELDLESAFHAASENLAHCAPGETDDPTSLGTQEKTLRIAKDVFIWLWRTAIQKFGKGLRDEQQFLGILSDMAIELWGSECGLLRSKRMMKGKDPSKGPLAAKMTGVLIHDAAARLASLARNGLEALEEGKSLAGRASLFWRLMAPPPLNVTAIRTEIADAMIRYSRYSV